MLSFNVVDALNSHYNYSTFLIVKKSDELSFSWYKDLFVLVYICYWSINDIYCYKITAVIV